MSWLEGAGHHRKPFQCSELPARDLDQTSECTTGNRLYTEYRKYFCQSSDF